MLILNIWWKEKVKKKLGHFFNMKIFKKKVLILIPMNMNPYLGFRKAVNFKSFFLSIIQMLYKELKWKNINK